MSAQSLIKVSGLAKSYGDTRAVEGVSFEVAAGKALALLGPNGSGKTTVLRCIAGLLRPDAGTIEVCGLDLRKQYREARRRFSYVPQQASFPAQVTVGETIRFHARLCGVSPQRVSAALGEAGISAADADKLVGALSGGMRQRLSLALAALPQVQVFLLDEPTANLDPEAVLRTRELARKWRDEGRALLFSTHVLADVEDLADEVVVLVAGRAVARESIGRLREQLSRRALLRVELDGPSERHRLAALECGATEARVNAHSLMVTAPVRHRFAILQRLGTMAEIRNVQTEEPSLEQVYLSYVEEKEAR